MNMLRSRLVRRVKEKKIKKPTRWQRKASCKPHVNWLLKNFDCAVKGLAGHVCCNTPMRRPRMVHHVRDDLAAGMSLRPMDSRGVVLCDDAHEEGHNKGWPSFEQKYGVDLSATADKAWAQSPKRAPYEAKMRREGLI